MRQSSLAHPLAVLRTTLGEKQEGFARVAKCSIHTIQSIESGRMTLSDEMALRISIATGVSVAWLLAGDPKAPILDKMGESYSLSSLRSAQSAEDAFQARCRAESRAHADLAYLASDILQILLTGITMPEYPLLALKLRRSVYQMMAEYRISRPVIDEAWLQKLRDYLNEGIKVVDRDRCFAGVDADGSMMRLAANFSPDAHRVAEATWPKTKTGARKKVPSQAESDQLYESILAEEALADDPAISPRPSAKRTRQRKKQQGKGAKSCETGTARSGPQSPRR